MLLLMPLLCHAADMLLLLLLRHYCLPAPFYAAMRRCYAAIDAGAVDAAMFYCCYRRLPLLPPY